MKYAVGCAVSLALVGAACTSGDRRLEPDELEARDLLGVSGRIAAGWDADERAAAREVLRAAWRDGEGSGQRLASSAAADAASATAALAALDGEREAAGEPPLIAGFAAATPEALATGPVAVLEWDLAGRVGSLIARDWRDDELELVERGGGLLVEVALAAGHPDGEALAVRPARGQPFGAIYAGRAIGLLVNPVLLAALEPRAAATPAVPLAVAEGAGEPEREAGARGVAARPVASGALGGNPYSFFGSVEECAAYQRLRCEDCLPSSSCEQTSRGAADGNAECMTLAEESGRGYFLYCTNLSLAIATVAACTGEEAPSCSQDSTASNDLADLEANAGFVDDATCLAGLDSCLAEIYGDPDQDFPGPVGADAGPTPTPPEPRDTETSCSGSDVNCDFSPQCDADCSSSCDNVLSCDADCNGSGSSGGCDSCGGEDTGSSGGDSGCGCNDDSGGGDGGGGCGSSDSSSGDSGCGNGCGGDSGGGCDSGGCGSSSDGGGGCNNSGGGGGGCVVSGGQVPAVRHCPRRARVEGFLAMFWSLLPLTYLERCRRRARRRELARAAAERRDGGAS